MEPTAVKCQGFHRQLTADTIQIQIQVETLSSIITLKISQNVLSLSQNLSKNPNHIYSTKSQVSNYSTIKLRFSCYKCFSFLVFELIYFILVF